MANSQTQRLATYLPSPPTKLSLWLFHATCPSRFETTSKKRWFLFQVRDRLEKQLSPRYFCKTIRDGIMPFDCMDSPSEKFRTVFSHWNSEWRRLFRNSLVISNLSGRQCWCFRRKHQDHVCRQISKRLSIIGKPCAVTTKNPVDTPHI
jgi:hypothetical protein